MAVTVTVKVDLSELKQFKKELDQDLRSGGQKTGGGPINNAFKQWGVRLRSYLQERFAVYSRGGGNWPPLKPSTIKRRRKGRGRYGMSAAILRDTGTLFNALTPEFTGKPGAIEERIPYGIRIGYGGPGQYTKKYGGVATIADIASFHQVGAGYLPKREIIVPPSEHVLSLMVEDMDRAIARMRRK